jgi:hypothetical protein
MERRKFVMAQEGLKRFSMICLILAAVAAVGLLVTAVLRLAGYVHISLGVPGGGLVLSLVMLALLTSAMAKRDGQKK